MRPADLRNATWREVLTHVTEDMVRVHLAWQTHGPGTTREVAQRSGISLLTLRPRTTDLYKLGLIVLVDNDKTTGIYASRTREEAEISRAWQHRADFRRRSDDEPTSAESVQRVGFITVDEAVASLSDAGKAALGASLMSKYGHHAQRRQSTPNQLTLLTP